MLIDDKILGALSRVELTSEEFRIIFVMLKHGIEEEIKWLPNEKFVEETGLSEEEVEQALNRLTKMNVIKKREE